MATISIEIAGDERDATQSIERVTQAVRRVEPACRQVGQVSGAVMRDMAAQQRQARDAAALFGRTLGVELPRQLEGFLAKSRTVGPVLAQAFNASILVGFAGAGVAALSRIPGVIENIVESMTHWREQSEKAIQMQRVMATSFEQARESARRYREELSLLGLEGSKRDAQEVKNASARLAEARDTLAVEQEKLHDLERRAQERVQSLSPALAAQLTPAAKEAKAKIDDQVQAVQAAAKAVGDLVGQYNLAAATQKNTLQKEIQETTKRMQEQAEAIRFVAGFDVPPTLRRPGDDLLDDRAISANIEEASGLRYARIAESLDSVQQKNHEVAEQVVFDWAAARDRMADQFVGLFDDLTSGNIGRAFQNQFKRMIAGMVADWAMGVRQMGAVSSVGFGGARTSGIQAALSSVFGGGFSVGGGAATPAASAAIVNDMALPVDTRVVGAPLSAGGAVNFGTTLPAGGSAIGTGVSSAAHAGMFSRIGSMLPSLFATGGLALASGAGFGDPLRGAIGGAGAAFAAGGILSTMLPFSAVGLAMPFLLPAIGIGALVGLFGAGKRRNERHRLEMQELAQIKTLLESYQAGLVDFGSAQSALQQMRNEYAQQFVRLKGEGHIAENVDSHINIAMSQLTQWEGQRQAEMQRRALIQFGPQMFGRGGMVGGVNGTVPDWFAYDAQRYARGGDVVAAMLTPGEFVMRPEAVRREGRARMEAINEGRGSSGGDTFNFTINTLDAQSTEDWLKRTGYSQFMRVARMYRQEGR